MTTGRVTDETLATWANVGDGPFSCTSGAVIAEMARELIALRAAVAWRPIETAPKDGVHVLIYPFNGNRVGEAYWHQPGNQNVAGFWMTVWGGAKHYPTHWMPLPLIPQPTKEGKG